MYLFFGTIIVPTQPRPYRHSPIFDISNLPAALTRSHATKAGVWAIVEVLEGRLRYRVEGGASQMLTPERPGLIEPQQPHSVAIEDGATRFRIAFYDQPPLIGAEPPAPERIDAAEDEQ